MFSEMGEINVIADFQVGPHGNAAIKLIRYPDNYAALTKVALFIPTPSCLFCIVKFKTLIWK